MKGGTFECSHFISVHILHAIEVYFFFSCPICNPTNGFSSSPSPPAVPSRPPRVQPPLACLPVHVAALPGCDVARRLRRGSRVRPTARRPPLSPGSEGRDMPAVATCPAATPTAAPAPPAAAAAPSPEALGTCGPAPQGGALAPRQARRGGQRAVPEGGSERGLDEHGGIGRTLSLPWARGKPAHFSRVCCSTALRAAAAGSLARSGSGALMCGYMLCRVLVSLCAPKGGGDAASPCVAVCFSSRRL